MKGRNANLIQLRNEHLIKRYYYWHDLERLRLDDVICKLSTEEVFLDEDYIRALIRANLDKLKQLRISKIGERQLKNFKFSNLPTVEQTSLFALPNLQ